MQCPSCGWDPFCFEVVLFVGRIFPRSADHSEWALEVGENNQRMRCTDDTSISTVKSVSGLTMEVLNLGPLWTVNHWPFLYIAH